MDKLIKTMSKDGYIRAYFADTTELVNTAYKFHNTSPVASAALGRTLTAAALIGAMQKNPDDKLTIQIKGGGPIGTVLAVANAKSEVKGYVGNPDVSVPLKPNGKLDVGSAVGTDGLLTIIKDIGLKEPYIGKTQLVSGEIADDLTVYFAKSEQVPTCVALGVLVDTDYTIKSSGGYIIQLLPGADMNIVEKIENRLPNVTPVSTMIANGHSPEDMQQEVLCDFDMLTVEEIKPAYVCDCSLSRVENALICMGKHELSDIIKSEGKAEITCHFCDKVYSFNEAQLRALINKCKK